MQYLAYIALDSPTAYKCCVGYSGATSSVTNIAAGMNTRPNGTDKSITPGSLTDQFEKSASIDLGRRWLTVEGDTYKTRQTRHVPLNDEAINLLSRWREQSAGDERVFAISTGFKTAWGKLLKRAKITRFRRHDVRHHFASRLVQRGVPLNTVRDLLGHSSVAMSPRYAHLAPDQRCDAVSKLNARPILSVTLALPTPSSRENISRPALISAALPPPVSPYRS
jgi:Phage integrase family